MNFPSPIPIHSAAVARIRGGVVFGLLAVVFLTGWHVLEDWEETVGRVEERVMAFTNVTEAYVRRRLRETESGMRVMADLHVQGLASAPAIAEIGRLHRRNFPFIAVIAVLEAESSEIVSADGKAAAPLLTWAREQKTMEGKLLVGRPLPSALGEVPLLPMLIRLRGSEGRHDTMVTAAIRSDFLALMHAALRLGKEKVSLVHNNEGVILSREPFDLRAIGFNLANYVPSGALPMGRLPAVNRITSPIDGRTFVYGTTQLSDHSLAVRGAEEWSTALAPWRERTERSVAIAAILACTIGLLGWLAMQRAKAEQAALLSQRHIDQLYRNALSTLTEGVITQGRDGSILTFNDAALRILGYTSDQLRGLTSLDPRWRGRREDGSDFPGKEHPAMQVLATGRPQYGVLMDIETGDGTRRWIEINAIPTHDSGGALSGVVVSFADVTTRRAILAQLESLNRTLETRVAERTAQLQQLGGELAAVEDRERRQISQDLHDDTAQILAVARIRLAALADETVDLTTGEVRDVARAVSDLISRADISIRSLAAQLAPPALSEVGLVAGLEWLADEMKRVYGLTVTVDDDGATKPLSQGTRMILFRAVRELLINVSKHAGVNRATVRCGREQDRIRIEVQDAGIGYDPRPQEFEIGRGLGLHGIGERLTYIGGSLEFSRVPGGGTRVTIAAPLADEDRKMGEALA